MENDVLELIQCIIDIYDDNNKGDGYLSEYEALNLIKTIIKIGKTKGKI